MKTDRDRAIWWEERAQRAIATEDYYRKELVKAHAMLGRVIQQLSERWSTVNLSEYYPTSNLIGKHSIDNPSGK